MKEIKRTRYIVAGVVTLATFILFLPAFKNEFVTWDDSKYIFMNFHIRSLDLKFFKWALFSFYAANWHPLTWISHAIDYAVWGLNPSGHHLTSILLHCMNTLLVALIIMRLLEFVVDHEKETIFLSYRGIFIASLITSLLFGLHPIHVESVAWISERKDVLCALFFLLSIFSYIRYVKDIKEERIVPQLLNRRYLTSLGLFFLSLLSKPMAVTLPIVLLIMDWYPFRRLEGAGKLRSALIEKLPFLAVSLLSAIIAFLAQRSGETVVSLENVPLLERILLGFKALIDYISKMLWPAKLMPFYPHPLKAFFLSFEYVFPLILVIGITAICIFLRRQRIWLAVWSYYVITLLPVLGIIQVGLQAMADRYTYLPSIGPFLLAGLGVAFVAEKVVFSLGRIVIYVLVVLLIGILSFSTVRQIGVWKNGITLWSKVIEVYPRIPMAYANRGDAYVMSGRFEEALKDYTQTINLSFVQFDDTILQAYYNRALIYAEFGRYGEAIEDYSQAIWMSVKPNYNYYNERGNAYAGLEQYEDALKDFNDAIRLNPNLGGLYFNRGNIYAKRGRLEEALKDYTEAIKLSSPPPSEYYINRGTVYGKLGLSEEARKDYQKAGSK